MVRKPRTAYFKQSLVEWLRRQERTYLPLRKSVRIMRKKSPRENSAGEGYVCTKSREEIQALQDILYSGGNWMLISPSVPQIQKNRTKILCITIRNAVVFAGTARNALDGFFSVLKSARIPSRHSMRQNTGQKE